MTCQKCGAENKRRAEFCETCGSAIEKHKTRVNCESCGQLVATRFQFCPNCGADIWQGRENLKPKNPRKRMSGVVKVVIVLSALIVVMVGLVMWGSLRYADYRADIDEARENAQTAKENSVITQNDEPDTTVEEQENSDESTWEDFFDTGYVEGVYEVGEDIPQGTYFLTYSDSETTEYCTFSNAPTEDLVDDKNHTSRFYIFDVAYIEDGDFIKLELCAAIPFEDIGWVIEEDILLNDDDNYDEGGYIVGAMIPAGIYEAVTTSNANNGIKYEIRVWDSIEQRRLELRGEAESSETIYYASNDTSVTITLEEGQYVWFDNVELVPKNLAIALPWQSAPLF